MGNEYKTDLELRTNIYTKRQSDELLARGTRVEGVLQERFLVEDTWDSSGRIRLREQRGEARDEIKLTADIPLTTGSWREILGVRFSANTPETAETLKSLGELLREEAHLSYTREVTAYSTPGGMAYLNRNLRVHKNGAEKNFYENPYYIQEGAEWLSRIRDKKTLLSSQETLELEIENEARIYVEPLELDMNRPFNKIEDTYALDGRFRLREKNDSMRYSIKVPLFSRDTDKTKACIRMEWKPDEQGEQLLRGMRDQIKTLPGTRVLRKQGQKLPYKLETGDLWINTNEAGKYWLEFDTIGGIPSLPAEIRPLSYRKSEINLT